MSEDKNRGYSMGYAAGKRRKERDIAREVTKKKHDAFWQRAFLAAIPAALTAEGWKRGEKPITMLEDRVRLAADVADEAVKHAVLHL